MVEELQARRAFVLADLASLLAVGGVMLALAIAGMAESRRTSRLDESIDNLKRINHGTESHAADFDGRLWGFTWQAGETVQYLDENGDLVETTLPDSDLQAAAYQAIHLIRLLDDRVGENSFPVPSNWMPHVIYSHLPLVEYLGANPLDRWTADPGDTVRANWKDDPIDKFDNGFWLPLQPDPGNPVNRRWPYSSSYNATPATWDQNQSDLEFGQGLRVSQGGTHNAYNVPPDPDLFPMNLQDVTYPAGKVYVHDSFQRHFGPCSTFYGFDDARIPLAFLDGSVSVRQTRDANPGWSPNSETVPCDVFLYQPSQWEPPSCDTDDNIAKGYYNWTRGGMKGLDFGGLPIDTGQQTPGKCDL